MPEQKDHAPSVQTLAEVEGIPKRVREICEALARTTPRLASELVCQLQGDAEMRRALEVCDDDLENAAQVLPPPIAQPEDASASFRMPPAGVPDIEMPPQSTAEIGDAGDSIDDTTEEPDSGDLERGDAQ